MPKCPLRARLYKFEGGDECQPDCALLVHATHWDSIERKPVDDGTVCAVTMIAMGIGYYDVEPLNTMEVDDGQARSV